MRKMQQDLQFYLRVAQALVAILALGLNSSVIAFYSTHAGLPPPPSPFVFLVFTATMTLLIALPYATFAPHYFRHSITPYTSLATEFITALFWFSGFVSAGVYLKGLDHGRCGGTVCHSARAGVAFAALEWVLWCVTLFFPVRHLLAERRTVADETGGGYNPSMSMGQKLKGWKLRRDAAHHDNAMSQFPKDSGEQDQAEEDGREGILQKLNYGFEVLKIRTGNIFARHVPDGARGRQSRHDSMV